MTVHSVSKKGKRPQNEDKHTIITNLNGQWNQEHKKNFGNINLYGVYDGHGGKEVSKFISQILPNYFLNKKIKYPIKEKDIEKVYEQVQQVLRTKYRAKALNCGSTCLVIAHFIYTGNEYLNIFNTGDSRAVICTDLLAMPLTKDHKPNWPEETMRIKKAGGEIYFDGCDYRIKDLSVSRAFGDIDAEPYVICKPDVFIHRITKRDKFVILACDGLWDVISNQDAINYVLDNCYDINKNQRINKKVNIAKKLADLAIEKKSGDNVTVLVVFFD
jgi:serine/threonine protein phosphatase PrpC